MLIIKLITTYEIDEITNVICQLLVYNHHN